MQWGDMTKRFQMEIELAIYRFVCGDPQKIVDLFQEVQESSFIEGGKYMIETLQEIIKKEE